MSSSNARKTNSPPPEAAARLKADVRSADARGEVVLRGELDLATVPIAEQAVTQVDADATTLVLDLRPLAFLDSSGLRMILSTAEAWSEPERRLFIVQGGPQVERVFDLTGAGSRLNVVQDPESIEAA